MRRWAWFPDPNEGGLEVSVILAFRDGSTGSYSLLHSDFEDSVEYMKPCLKLTKRPNYWFSCQFIFKTFRYIILSRIAEQYMWVFRILKWKLWSSRVAVPFCISTRVRETPLSSTSLLEFLLYLCSVLWPFY